MALVQQTCRRAYRSRCAPPLRWPVPTSSAAVSTYSSSSSSSSSPSSSSSSPSSISSSWFCLLRASSSSSSSSCKCSPLIGRNVSTCSGRRGGRHGNEMRISLRSVPRGEEGGGGGGVAWAARWLLPVVAHAAECGRTCCSLRQNEGDPDLRKRREEMGSLDLRKRREEMGSLDLRKRREEMGNLDLRKRREDGGSSTRGFPRMVRSVATKAVAPGGAAADASASTLRFCVVGSGPAGFYTAERLLKTYPHSTVDILEKLPSPFGLVRSGVAPDHPETKAVINQFSRLASVERCKFWGNVHVGQDVSVEELRRYYNAVVFAYGAEGDKRLGIPGEDYTGVFSAREFVWWYNGHPEYAQLAIDLTRTDTAVVLGQGNVALDCARVLLRSVDELAKTDISEYALEVLRGSRIRTVLLIGRRGPAQAACTAKELREILALRSVRVNVKLSDTSLTDIDKEQLKNSRSHRRVHELFVKAATASEDVPNGDRQINFTFFRAPKEILGKKTESGYCVQGLQLERTVLQGGGDGRPQRAVGTSEMEDLSCGLVLRSIGYRSLPLPGLPFDNVRGVVPNSEGRVLAKEGTQECEQGMYVVGWLKRGPTGIIGTNLICADQTVASIIEDEKQGLLPTPVADEGGSGLRQLLSDRTQVVSFDGWKKIDSEEVRRGALKGKPREKIVCIEEMLKLSTGETAT